MENLASDIGEARRRMSLFIQTLVIATGTYGLKRTLRIKNEQFYSQELASGYPLARWRNDRNVSPDERNFWRVLTTKHPFLIDHDALGGAALMMECHCGGKPAIGLQAALLLDTIAISVLSDTLWDNAEVTLTVSELDQEGIWLPERMEQVTHASHPDHLRVHARWIKQRQQAETDHELRIIQSGAELWSQRHIVWPSLTFCAVVEQQLRKNNPQINHIEAIRLRLQYLEQYSKEWVQAGGAFDPLKLAGRASPESKPTLEHPKLGPMRVFSCPDGQNRVFSWHLKLGSGWRIHFYPDEEQHVIIIGYIGPHLSTVVFS
ncbi:MAG: hypothetical protein HC837_05825 [Chloroflexaceae bacterium]|nr:hypothetical protein [Chloroflexaceae bacterium]